MDQLTEADFAAHPVWASYDDPEEMELLEGLGFEATQVMSAFESLATPEEKVFPLPSQAASLPFRYLWLSAVVSLPSGTELVGYRTSACLGIYHHGNLYLFNKAMPDLSQENAERLASYLGAPAIFPAHVYCPATSKVEAFSL
ncbi:hypothetical protein [Pseudorhodoferax soli]|uniref:hypothetical protein n=1 Tax=Pseudorhodoferax soli TaxID=545864 RepID=UPI0011C04396|nr:hypothetical protein [Pseudorhodoferax soli]